ncbi:hypothetical protein Q5L94_08375 [Idiomarina sp. Sol25]|uniref:hypothetical protein n=1 Tax=Idiomarina sp. Sol25 TaxID=3064000 RepID=UPI00294AB2B4|nr:hypothetical protein [Idiomarina sp. Sol25]MDV6328072.1 hypothetical protein [Idiomarina sp. Sol25]
MTDNLTTINSVHVFNEQQTAVTKDHITQQLSEQSGTVYVFYSDPSVYIANKLSNGVDAQTACNDWLARIDDILNIQRKNRRRIRLICIQNALAQSVNLEEQTGIAASALADFNVQPGDLTLMAGHQIVLQNPDIISRLDRLEALTLQLEEQPYQVEVDAESALAEAVKADAKAKEAEAEAKAAHEKLKEIEEENELLLLQLQQVQEELETTFISKQQLSKDHEGELKQKDEKAQELERQQSELKSELEQLNVQNKQLTTQVETLKKEAAEAKTAVPEQPEKLKEVEEENELLLLQLQQVQEELENYFIKYQDAQKQCVEQQHTITQLKKSTGTPNDNDIALVADKSDAPQTVQKPKRSLFYRIKRRLGLVKKNKTNGLAKQHRDLIAQSIYFDANWYLETYPDVAKEKVDPAEHYLRFGGFEGRNPSESFNNEFYRQAHPDVAAEGINPLLHYELYGKDEGRLPKPY